MAEKTPVIIRSTSKRTEGSDFKFTEGQIRETKSTIINQLRQEAWQIFKNTPIPTVREEAWRRTDLRSMKTDKIKLLDSDELSQNTIPENLLKPVADGDHGGQIILNGEFSRITLEDSLRNQGVIFTDLLTAEQ